MTTTVDIGVKRLTSTRPQIIQWKTKPHGGTIEWTSQSGAIYHLIYSSCQEFFPLNQKKTPVEMWWHTATHERGREGETVEWSIVASTLHTTSEHGVSSITTADAHTSAASSRLNWRPPADLNGLANAVSSQYSSHYLGTWCIQHYYRWCAHLGCQ